jgi:hypothetical protein
LLQQHTSTRAWSSSVLYRLADAAAAALLRAVVPSSDVRAVLLLWLCTVASSCAQISNRSRREAAVRLHAMFKILSCKELD